MKIDMGLLHHAKERVRRNGAQQYMASAYEYEGLVQIIEQMEQEVERVTNERDSVCHLNDSLSLENERLKSAIGEAWSVPVPVKEGTAEAEDVQEIKDILSIALAEE